MTSAGTPSPAPGPAEPWWVRNPERLEYELQALEDSGVRFERDEGAYAHGIMRLRVFPTIVGREVELLVTFPDLYPYFRFTVETVGDERLPHHQSPVGPGRLCFLGRATQNWRLSDTLADMLTTQIPRVFEAGSSDSREEVAEVEEHQAEPFSEWYPYAPAMLHIDGRWRVPDDATSGEFRALLFQIILGDGGHPVPLGFVTEVRDQDGVVIADHDPQVTREYQGHSVRGRWVRTAAPIVSFDAEDMFTQAAALDSQAKQAPWEPIRGNTNTKELQLQLRAVVFPEEHAWRDASGQGWVFVVRGQTRRVILPQATSNNSRFIPPKGKKGAAPTTTPWVQRSVFVRAGRAGPEDLAQRVPQLASMREARIAMVGLGCIGAPSALEFARAQVAELRMMDGDIVDPGNIVRWPYGLGAAGQSKALVLAGVVNRDYPYTRATAEPRRLGDARAVPAGASETPDDTDGVILERLTANASLIYDASAEFGVQWFLSEYARERSIPYISVTGTQGGWGGRIVRIRPGVTPGCWACMQAAREEGSLPDPPADLAGIIEPAGCAEPTFTAASFDMVSIAMHGVRLAASTLCGGRPGAYPSVDWDVAIIALRDETGSQIAPTVQTFALPRHPACPACAIRG